jgi:hypothetical protein
LLKNLKKKTLTLNLNIFTTTTPKLVLVKSVNRAKVALFNDKRIILKSRRLIKLLTAKVLV